MRRLVPFAVGFVVVAWAVVVVRTDGPATTPPRPLHWAPHLVDPSTTTTMPPSGTATQTGPVQHIPPVTGPAQVYPL